MNFKKFLCTGLFATLVVTLGACSSDDETADPTPTPTPTATPTPSSVSWSEVTASGNHHEVNAGVDMVGHTCGIQSDGTLWCWGNNKYGQLGDGTYTSSDSPVQVGTESDWIHVNAGGNRTCGIRGSDGTGSLWCWGSNRRYGEQASDVWNGDSYVGLLGLGDAFWSAERVNTPTQVGSASDWESVGLANHSGCGIRNDGTNSTLWCWGANSNGAIAQNSTNAEGYNSPQQETQGFTDWVSVAGCKMGYECNSQCGIRDNGTDRTLWCWGYGSGDISGNDIPTQEPDDETNWSSISMTGNHTACGLKTDGTIECQSPSGNNHGQAGTGDFASPSAFTAVNADTTWTAIDVGRQFACGINDGDLYCWGRGYVGELGAGDVSADPYKGTCDTIGTVDACAETSKGTCGTVGTVDACSGTSNGTCNVSNQCTGDTNIYCTDDADCNPDICTDDGDCNPDICTADADCEGNLCEDDNLWTDSGYYDCPAPLLADDTNTWTSISAGFSHACAITDGGDLYCWGDNSDGQAGQPVGTLVNTPTMVQ